MRILGIIYSETCNTVCVVVVVRLIHIESAKYVVYDLDNIMLQFRHFSYYSHYFVLLTCNTMVLQHFGIYYCFSCRCCLCYMAVWMYIHLTTTTTVRTKQYTKPISFRIRFIAGCSSMNLWLQQNVPAKPIQQPICQKFSSSNCNI